jgi:hypothetical protein
VFRSAFGAAWFYLALAMLAKRSGCAAFKTSGLDADLLERHGHVGKTLRAKKKNDWRLVLGNEFS